MLLSPPPAQPHRRIRFAPLPDPRRAVLITDDGLELPIPVQDREPSSAASSSADDLAENQLESSIATPETIPSAIPASVSLAAINGSISTPNGSPVTRHFDLPSASPPSSYRAPSKPKKSSLLKVFGSTSKAAPISDSSSTSSSNSESLDGSSLTNGSTPSSSVPLSRTTSASSTNNPGAQTPTEKRPASSQGISLGPINLFRTRSKGDTTPQAVPMQWGHSLQRWTSGGSAASSINSTSSTPVGVPMRRTMSTQSATGSKKGSSKSLFRFMSSKSSSSSLPRERRRSTSTSSDSSGLLATLHSADGNSKKGTRMLNGRVYGAKRHDSSAGSSPNPFANVPDAEPEFVEWGYGGMGSVKNGAGVGGRVWGKLMSDNSSYGGVQGQANGDGEGKKGVGGEVPSGAKAPSADEEDDGSGMGWVKRRREQREREKLEREAKEKEERERLEKEEKEKQDPIAGEGEQSADQPSPPALAEDISPQKVTLSTPNTPTLSPSPLFPDGDTEAVSPGLSALASPPFSGSTITPGLASPPMLSPQPSYGSAMTSPTSPGDHLTQAITVPAPRPRYAHHRHASEHHKTHDGHEDDDQIETPADHALGVKSPLGREDSSTSRTSSVASSASSTSETDSESDSASSDGSDDEDDDLDDDETRKTSLGAGVEKISRHK
ncbi:hypothetical protein C8J56DRAFT_1057529 [Mycena floridula]|nr:hypothetical protein C8J56DRAFT_1057529 [Mycena floridula]